MQQLVPAWENVGKALMINWSRETYPLFTGESGEKALFRMQEWLRHDFSKHRQPEFTAEVSPAIEPLWLPVSGTFEGWMKQPGDHQTRDLVEKLEQLGLADFLLLLGQRLTPASARGLEALPPSEDTIQRSALKLYNPFITNAARALAKHTDRGVDQFWGVVRGNQVHQNQVAADKLEELIRNATWWNIFEHYAQGLVYEIRVESGHGSRWSADGEQFIGFLEPFLDEKV